MVIFYEMWSELAWKGEILQTQIVDKLNSK